MTNAWARHIDADSERNWPQIYPLGFLPEFHPDVTDYSLAGGYLIQPTSWKKVESVAPKSA